MCESTPFFERLCPAMTQSVWHAHSPLTVRPRASGDPDLPLLSRETVPQVGNSRALGDKPGHDAECVAAVSITLSTWHACTRLTRALIGPSHRDGGGMKLGSNVPGEGINFRSSPGAIALTGLTVMRGAPGGPTAS